MSITKVSYSMITGTPLNVLDVGVIGDGVADDTVAIQTALDSGVKSIFFPPGTYKVTGQIHIPDIDELTIFGAGKSSQIYFDANGLSGSTEIYLGNKKASGTYTTSNIFIKDIWLKGHYVTNNTPPGGGVSFGVKFENTVENLDITNCYFSNFSSYSCQVLDGSGVNISNNSFFRGYRAAIALGSANTNWVRQFVVADNILSEFVNTTVDADGVLLAGAEYGSVTGNTVYFVGSTGIKLGVANYTAVTGNKIRKVVDGIKIQNGGNFNSVVGNNVNQCRSGVAALSNNSNIQTNHLHIADNVIEDCTAATNWIVTEFGAPDPGSNYGVYIDGGATDTFNYLAVVNNQISNAQRGVSLANALYNYAFLSGNQARDGVVLGYTYTDTAVAGSIIFQADQLAGSRDFPFSNNRWISSLLLGGVSDSATNRRTLTTASAIPTTGTWAQGDVVFNTAPAAGGTPGWVCVTSGTPGTWKAMANIAA